MPVQLQHSRGDIALGKKLNLQNGQFFWSYINTDAKTSAGHSYSEGQLWIKDPLSEEPVEIANRRTLNGLVLKGFIDDSFNGDFVNANEVTQAAFKHCHEGDYWIFKTKQVFYKDSKAIKFYKGDILLIVDATYEESSGDFREQLKSVDYIKISLPVTDTEESDLSSEDYNATVQELELRLDYRGEFDSFENFINLTKKKGYTYVLTKTLYLPEATFVEEVERPYRATIKEGSKRGLIPLRPGDLIKWNGKSWSIVPVGQNAENLLYDPNEEEIDAVISFADYHKEDLKATTNVQEALDVLNRTKAHLGKNGRIPYEELPEEVSRGLTLQGIWYPVHNSTEEDANDPANQEPWPERTSDFSNYFWIIDCYGKRNVQYADPADESRIVELNTGDMLIFSSETQRYEVVDNSDRLTSIEVTVPTIAGEKHTLLGNVGLTSDGKIEIYLKGNTIVLGGSRLIGQSALANGVKGYLPVYADDENNLINSTLFQDDELQTIASSYSFRVGKISNKQSLDTYGNIGVYKTAGATKTTFNNNYLFIETAHTLKTDNGVFYRQSNVRASERNNFATADEELDIWLPEASSLLVGILEDDSLTPDYFTKTAHDGFITDTLTSENCVTDEENLRQVGKFDENYEEGYENIGIGRTTSEDLESGEITFYAKTKDRLHGRGFFTRYHSLANRNSQNYQKLEHWLNRTETSRTHLVINPTILEDEVETFVKMPFVSGTLLTWEEIVLLFGSRGIPLMIPAWEKMRFRAGEFIGLDTSPITIKLNRPAHDNVEVTRENDLSKDYGSGKKSTWSYIHSSQEGSLQDDTRGSVDDVVSFDSWFEAERSVATKEAFIIPSTAKKDGKSRVDPETLDYSADVKETKNDLYGKDKEGGMYQRILPSRTLYESEPVYYEPVTGEQINQNITLKDVEMPAVGGVLLTSRSRVDGGVWL